MRTTATTTSGPVRGRVVPGEPAAGEPDARLTTVGALYLTVVALIPQFMLQGFQFDRLPWIGPWIDSILRQTPLTSWLTTGVGIQFYFGGTSLLILIGVAMDTMNQVESQLVMRHYDGFLGPRGRRPRRAQRRRAPCVARGAGPRSRKPCLLGAAPSPRPRARSRSDLWSARSLLPPPSLGHLPEAVGEIPRGH